MKYKQLQERLIKSFYESIISPRTVLYKEDRLTIGIRLESHAGGSNVTIAMSPVESVVWNMPHNSMKEKTYMIRNIEITRMYKECEQFKVTIELLPECDLIVLFVENKLPKVVIK